MVTRDASCQNRRTDKPVSKKTAPIYRKTFLSGYIRLGYFLYYSVNLSPPTRVTGDGNVVVSSVSLRALAARFFSSAVGDGVVGWQPQLRRRHTIVLSEGLRQSLLLWKQNDRPRPTRAHWSYRNKFVYPSLLPMPAKTASFGPRDPIHARNILHYASSLRSFDHAASACADPDFPELSPPASRDILVPYTLKWRQHGHLYCIH